MGFLSFRRGRKAPSPLPIPQHGATLLDRFLQEVGSASSASSWVIPDIINRCVEEHPFSPSDLQSPRYKLDSFEKPPLGLRDGNMDVFDDCDPNSIDALEVYQDLIHQYDQDEESSQPQGSQESLQNIRQVSQPTELRVNPEIGRQNPAATIGLHPQIFRSPPSVDDSDDDEEPDEFSRRCGFRQCRSFITNPDSDSDSDSDDGSESQDSSNSDDENEIRSAFDSASSFGRRTACQEFTLWDNDRIDHDVQSDPPINSSETDLLCFADDEGSDDGLELHSSRSRSSGLVLSETMRESPATRLTLLAMMGMSFPTALQLTPSAPIWMIMSTTPILKAARL
jgi:hypothetical protein